MHSPGKPQGPFHNSKRPNQPPAPEQPEKPNLFLYFGEDFQPFHDMVLVECRFLEEVHGIAVPDSVKEKQMTACVVRVGPGRMLESGQMRPPPCSEGQFVFAMISRGIPIKLGSRAMVLLNSSDVLGAFPDGPARPKVAELHSDMGVTICQCGHPEEAGMIHRTDMPCFPKAQDAL